MEYRGVKEGESAVEGTGTWAHVVFSLSKGLSFAVVSDSVLNEARVGFLSHPKTMCRAAPTVVSLPSVCLGSFRVFLYFALSVGPAAFTGFLHQISYTYDLGTGRFCDQVPLARAAPSRAGARVPVLAIVVKRTKNDPARASPRK